MSISYDVFTNAFLDKIEDFNFPLTEYERNDVIDGYMKRAMSAFKKVCKYNFTTTGNATEREFDIDVADEDIDELADIISEGMVVQWLKPYAFRQENLENILNTRDFSYYSSAELLRRINDVHRQALLNFKQMIREYSYDHGDLSDLHL